MSSDWETYDRPATGNDVRAVEQAVLECSVPRRERIATAVLQGMATADRTLWDAHGPVLAGHAKRAVAWADALIAELDK